MYLFLSDETNTTQSEVVEFLIFGAIIVPIDKASEIASEIVRIRQAAGYPPEAEFKFDTHSRPSCVTKAKFDYAKSLVLDLARNLGIRFMAYVVHHEIASRKEPSKRPLFALNTLLCQFDLFLSRERTSGFCAVDRFEIAHSLLSSILVEGVNPSGELGKFQRKLSNIWMYSITTITCSHLCSVCDIVLGAFRYCVNATRTSDVTNMLYSKVRPLFLCQPDNPQVIEDWGLFFRPRTVRSSRYAEAYQGLRSRLTRLEQC